jgi:large subunit ribosomal protein L19
MLKPLIGLVEKANLKSDVPDFRIGDLIEVHQKILDGAKERIQIFEGAVIGRQNGGVRETVTVRRLVQGEGVERIFPIHSPRIAKIVIKKAGSVRRAKLFYLRDRVGKATKIKEDVKRQAKIDTDLKVAAEMAAKAAQEAAAKATAEGGMSKTAQKKKARKEAEAAKKK